MDASHARKMQLKWHTPSAGGNDILHLSGHSLRPLQNEGDKFMSRGTYQQIYSDSYSNWGYGLLNVSSLGEPTLIRVSVKVHLSMDAHSCLGHFLLTPGATYGRYGKEFNVAIRFVNDVNALRMIQSGKFSI